MLQKDYNLFYICGMIKANELRIGNIIIDETNNIYTIVAGDEIDNYDNYNPIPLTPEILEKAGFELYKDTFCYNDFRLRKQYLTPERKEYKLVFHPFIDFIGGDKQMQYVHQLQNLYFALTGEELMIEGLSVERSVATKSNSSNEAG